MRYYLRGLLLSFVALIAATRTEVSPGAEPPAAEAVDFAHDVAPVLQKFCVECHGGEKAEGGFSLNNRALVLESGTVVPRKAGESTLIERITSSDPETQMPPADKPRLSEKQILTLRTWIDSDLPWETGLTFAADRYEPPLAPRRVELPPVQDGRENPVDRLIDAYWKERGVDRPAPLGDAEFLRRLRLDLVGLPPTPEELAAFIADPGSEKRRMAIEQTLADSHAYAQHWLSFWNDLLRNDYAGTGYIDGGRKQISAWLYAALVENRPYDQFVRDLVAPAPDAEGFINGIQWRGNVNASQVRPVQFAQSISQVFLGINMKCASCHDSFIDRWKLDEAYGLAAIYAIDPIEIHRCDKPTGKTAAAKWIFPELGDIDAAAPQPERLKQLAALMTHPENGRTTRTIVNRLWRNLMGRGIIHPVDAMHTPPWSADLLDFLASDLAAHGYDLKHTLALICNSQVYQSAVVVQREAPSSEGFVFHGPSAKRFTAEQYLDAIWRITGAGPEKADAPISDLSLADSQQGNRPFVRAALVKSDLLMRSLGRPNREQIVTVRPETLTMLEAIDLANGAIMADTLARGANKLAARSWKGPDELIDWLYAFALARQPMNDERQVAHELLGIGPDEVGGKGGELAATGVEDLLWSVFMLPEFQMIW